MSQHQAHLPSDHHHHSHWAWLSRMIRPEVRLMGKTVPIFQVLGVAGFFFAGLYGQIFAPFLGLPAWMSPVVLAIGMASFLATAYTTRWLTSTESLTYYHQMAIFLALMLVPVGLSGHSLLSGLDLYMTAFNVFGFWGRLGCLNAGCCHGVPAKGGIVYSQRYVAAGFSRELVGIPLLPTQLIESLANLTLVIAASIAIVLDAPAGIPFLIGLAPYALLRFVLEFFRADLMRPYRFGISEAQWTSLVILAGLSSGAWAGWWRGAWPLSFLAAGCAGVVAYTAYRDGHKSHLRRELVKPIYFRELLRLSQDSMLINTGTQVRDKRIKTTSFGLAVSAERLQVDEQSQKQEAIHYAFSSSQDQLAPEDLEVLGHLLQTYLHPGLRYEHLLSEHGVGHLIFREKSDSA